MPLGMLMAVTLPRREVNPGTWSSLSPNWARSPATACWRNAKKLNVR